MDTKLSYMRACLHQWEWLSENPTMDKYDYRQSHNVEKMKNGCPACEWASKGLIDTDCSKCFLNNYAWSPMDYACEYDPESPYSVWAKLGDYTPEELLIRKDAAHKMVEAIKMAIADESEITEKYLGKIEKVFLGIKDSQLGLHITLSGGSWRTQTSESFWDTNEIKCNDRCTWTESDRNMYYSSIMRYVSDLLKDAKVSDIADLKGKPVEATFKNTLLESWCILTEVL